MHDIIEMAGGTNLAAVHGIQGWQVIDAETIIAMAPEVIVTYEGPEVVARILNDPVLQNVPAVRERPGVLGGPYGSREPYYILAIEELAEYLHPEAF